MLIPNAIVLYVNNITVSSAFYETLFGIFPEESSPTFRMFDCSNGMKLGLKDKRSVEPSPEESIGGHELVFILDNKEQVDALYSDWTRKKIQMAQIPTHLPYGYTFAALDPDGHRLRIVSMGEKS